MRLVADHMAYIANATLTGAKLVFDWAAELKNLGKGET